MKKLLLVLAIGAFAACGDGASEDSTTTDSASALPVDTNTLAQPDTTAAPAPADSTAIKADSSASK
jgi:hypothetical protein